MKKPESMTSKIHKRMQIAESERAALIKDLKRLQQEAPDKLKQLADLASSLVDQLEKDPSNQQLQKEYAGALLAQKMVSAGQGMTEGLLQNE